MLTEGSLVWAPFGDHGWRAAMVTGLGKNRGERTVVHLSFETGGHGTRYAGQLYWRKAELKGKDKRLRPMLVMTAGSAAWLFAAAVIAGALGLTAQPALAITRAEACTAPAVYTTVIAADRDKGIPLDDERHNIRHWAIKEAQKAHLTSDQRTISLQNFDTLVLDVYNSPALSGAALQTKIYNYCINHADISER
jgi:hypothetical protein